MNCFVCDQHVAACNGCGVPGPVERRRNISSGEDAFLDDAEEYRVYDRQIQEELERQQQAVLA